MYKKFQNGCVFSTHHVTPLNTYVCYIVTQSDASEQSDNLSILIPLLEVYTAKEAELNSQKNKKYAYFRPLSMTNFVLNVIIKYQENDI